MDTSRIDSPFTTDKPSAEIQALVMQLWNAVRETTQATSNIVNERNALQKKFVALEGVLQQEQQKCSKMQAYIEHLEQETKQKEEDIAHLQAQAQEQARNIHDRVQEIVSQEDELERLRDELGASNDRLIQANHQLEELQPLFIEAQEEKARLIEENDRLRWQCNAITEQTEQEQNIRTAEYERALEELRATNERLLLEVQEWQRIAGEYEQQISALEAERDKAITTADTLAQDAQTWQQIAEEQERSFAEKENVLRMELTRTYDDKERFVALQEELQKVQNLLILEKAAHDQAVQTLQANFDIEHKAIQQTHQEELSHLQKELQEAREEYIPRRQELIDQNTIEREALEQTINTLTNDLKAYQQREYEREQTYNALCKREEEAQKHIEDLTEQLSLLHKEYTANVQTENETNTAALEQQESFAKMLSEAVEKAKQEAQIRLEAELDASRQLISMKDREIDLLRTNIEGLQATNYQASVYAGEREARISELETLLLELDAERNKLENTDENHTHHPAMSEQERNILASKVRQMLARVEAALEEEVR